MVVLCGGLESGGCAREDLSSVGADPVAWCAGVAWRGGVSSVRRGDIGVAGLCWISGSAFRGSAVVPSLWWSIVVGGEVVRRGGVGMSGLWCGNVVDGEVAWWCAGVVGGVDSSSGVASGSRDSVSGPAVGVGSCQIGAVCWRLLQLWSM